MFYTEEKYHSNYSNRFKRGVVTVALAAIILAATGAAFAGEGAGWNQDTNNSVQSSNAWSNCPPPQYRHIDPPALPEGFPGVAYSRQLFWNGGSGEDRWSVAAGSLPPGLTLNAASGLISGTPAPPGAYNFRVRVEKVAPASCSIERAYTIIVVAASITTLTASDNPVTAGQAITLTARVGALFEGVPTGAAQFKLNGLPLGGPVLLVGGTASLNTTAPDGGGQGYFTVTASYSGDGNFWPSSDGLSLSVFVYAVRDDATGDRLFFNSDGTYQFIHFAGGSSLVLKGKGTILASARGGAVILENIAADREVRAELNTCDDTGVATVIYQGVTYILTQGAASSAYRRR